MAFGSDLNCPPDIFARPPSDDDPPRQVTLSDKLIHICHVLGPLPHLGSDKAICLFIPLLKSGLAPKRRITMLHVLNTSLLQSKSSSRTLRSLPAVESWRSDQGQGNSPNTSSIVLKNGKSFVWNRARQTIVPFASLTLGYAGDVQISTSGR